MMTVMVLILTQSIQKAVKITPVGVTINDEKSNAIASDERLYMFVGTYLVYGTWNSGTSYEVREVANDEDTYIPIHYH